MKQLSYTQEFVVQVIIRPSFFIKILPPQGNFPRSCLNDVEVWFWNYWLSKDVIYRVQKSYRWTYQPISHRLMGRKFIFLANLIFDHSWPRPGQKWSRGQPSGPSSLNSPSLVWYSTWLQPQWLHVKWGYGLFLNIFCVGVTS